MSVGAVEQPEYPNPWFTHEGPWTEEDFLRLPESTWPRVELIEGSLLVSPAPEGSHQLWVARLWRLLDEAAGEDMAAIPGVSLRCGPNRVPIPDLLVTRELESRKIYQSDRAVLVAEVVSPHGRSRDWVLKNYYYAEAGIPWYLLVEQDDQGQPVLVLRRLEHDHYVEHGRAECGQVLEIPQPAVAVDPQQLLHR